MHFSLYCILPIKINIILQKYCNISRYMLTYSNIQKGNHMRKILKHFHATKIILALLLLLNIALWILLTLLASTYIYMAISIIGLCLFFGIMNDANEGASYKIMWMFVFVILPIFGVVLYIQIRSTKLPLQLRKLYYDIAEQSSANLVQNSDTMAKLSSHNMQSGNISQYLVNTEHWPVYASHNTLYFGDGQEYFDHMLQCISNAQKFVLIEFFILEEGQLWDKFISVLRDRADNGVEIKLLYDDFGCMDRFTNRRTLKNLSQYGIQTAPFNRVRPTINKFTQLRSHRKIVVVDGLYAYTGGMNIADEYPNITSPLGHWKDAGIRICGQAVWSMTTMFYDNWQLATNKLIDTTLYRVDADIDANLSTEYIQPYGATPLTNTPTARDMYIKLINSAKQYIYITTPYLVLDHEIILALRLASQSGVDVRIFMPGRPDKKYVYYLSKTYYKDLTAHGVKIYHYTPGFLHAKVVLVDGNTATVGSINMDFRSLYLHFEDSVLIHNSIALQDIAQDIQQITSDSQLVTLQDIQNRRRIEKILGGILRLVAPLM